MARVQSLQTCRKGRESFGKFPFCHFPFNVNERPRNVNRISKWSSWVQSLQQQRVFTGGITTGDRSPISSSGQNGSGNCHREGLSLLQSLASLSSLSSSMISLQAPAPVDMRLGATVRRRDMCPDACPGTRHVTPTFQ